MITHSIILTTSKNKSQKTLNKKDTDLTSVSSILVAKKSLL